MSKVLGFIGAVLLVLSLIGLIYCAAIALLAYRYLAMGYPFKQVGIGIFPIMTAVELAVLTSALTVLLLIGAIMSLKPLMEE